ARTDSRGRGELPDERDPRRGCRDRGTIVSVANLTLAGRRGNSDGQLDRAIFFKRLGHNPGNRVTLLSEARGHALCRDRSWPSKCLLLARSGREPGEWRSGGFCPTADLRLPRSLFP